MNFERYPTGPMRAVAVPEPGGPEAAVVVERPIPMPAAEQVLVEVAAAGVSRPDILQRRGEYPPPPGASDILGLELAGTIIAVGSGVRDWKVGDRVCGLVSGGGYAEYAVVPFQQLLPVPEGWSFVEAASLPENYCTVWDNLFTRGQLTAGEKILIHGGSSGIGSTAIQLAKAFGAMVATTAGSEEKCRFCESIGADRAINYHDQDFVAAVREWTEGRGVALVLDIVGSAYLQKNLDALDLDGRLVMLANLGGNEGTFEIWKLLQRRLSIIASSMKARTVEQKGAIIFELRRCVWPRLDDRRIAPLVDEVFPLHRVSAAHAKLESSAHQGKIVLTVK